MGNGGQLKNIIERCFKNPSDKKLLSEFDCLFRPFIMAVLVSFYGDHLDKTEDVYQTTFIKIIKIFTKGKKPGMNYVAYFTAIAKNAMIDEIRKIQPIISIDQFFKDYGLEFINYNPYDYETRLEILQGLLHLDFQCRSILTKLYFYSYEPKEIAEILNINPPSIYMNIKRCKEKLRKILERC